MQITDIAIEGVEAKVTFEVPELLGDRETIIIRVEAAPAGSINDLKILALNQLTERLNSALGQASDLRTGIMCPGR